MSPRTDRRRAIAATQDRVFHADLRGTDLRQRNPLAGRANQSEIGNPARIEPRASGGTGRDLHRTDIFADIGDRDAAQQELQLLRDVAGRQPDALEPVLIECETQRRHALAPVGVGRSH
jgi:hypothetical protein